MRNDDANPTTVTIYPCCKFLTCQGFRPADLKTGAYGANSKLFRGICLTPLDGDYSTALKRYKDYVKNLP